MADTLKCPCGGDIEKYYAYGDAGDRGVLRCKLCKREDILVIFEIWQTRAMKAELEVTRLTAELEAVNERVDGLTFKNIMNIFISEGLISKGGTPIKGVEESINKILKAVK